MAQANKQLRIVEGAEPLTAHGFEHVAFFDADGNPVNIGGGGDVSVAWGDVTGKPSEFPPASHDHTIAQVTGLQDALDDRATQAALDALAARVEALENGDEG